MGYEGVFFCVRRAPGTARFAVKARRMLLEIWVGAVRSERPVTGMDTASNVTRCRCGRKQYDHFPFWLYRTTSASATNGGTPMCEVQLWVVVCIHVICLF